MNALPFIYFMILLIFNSFRKKRIITVSNLLVGTYALGGLCSFILSQFVVYDDINIHASLYYLVCLSLLIIPHIYFYEARVEMQIVKLNHPHLKLFYIIYFLLQFYAILFYLPSMIDALSGDIAFNRLLVNTGEFKDRGHIDLIISFVGSAWPISLTMFFYSAISGEKPFYSLMFLLCSLFGPIYVMAHAGRSGITQWLMLFLLNYIFLRSHLKNKMKSVFGGKTSFKLIKIAAILLLVLIIVPFINITSARFIGDTTYTQGYVDGLFMSIIEYFGQSYTNFSTYYTYNWLDQKIYFGQYTSPLFYGILKLLGIMPDYSNELVMNEIYSFHRANGLQLGTFNTLLKELSIDYGLWGVLILCVLYFCVCLAVVRKKKRFWSLPRMLTYIFLFTIPYYGIFYYSYGDSLANVTMVYYILSVFLSSRLLKA